MFLKSVLDNFLRLGVSHTLALIDLVPAWLSGSNSPWKHCNKIKTQVIFLNKMIYFEIFEFNLIYI